tara:strand:- start:1101 stop:1982 length:882 start_codon:yes stop_codon:yes gene_type:complete
MSFETLGKSLKYLIKYPILFLPDIILMLISYILLYLLYIYTGAADLSSLITSIANGAEAEAAVVEALRIFVLENLNKVIVSVISFFVITFVVGVGVAVIKFEMIRDMLLKRKPSIQKAWKNRKSFFWPVVLLNFLIFLISVISLIIVFALSGFVFLLINPFTSTGALVLSGAIAVISTIALLLIVKFSILFRYPIMFIKGKKNAWKVVKESYYFFRKKPLFVIITWLIIFIVGILFSLAGSFIGAFFTSLNTLINVEMFILILTALSWIIRSIFSLAADIWGNVYLFAKFKES